MGFTTRRFSAERGVLALFYGLEAVACKAELEVATLKMLRFVLGVTRMDRIRNEYTRGTGQVGWFGEKAREARKR